MTTNRISLAALVVAVIALGIGIFGGGKTTEIIRETVNEIVGATPGDQFPELRIGGVKFVGHKQDMAASNTPCAIRVGATSTVDTVMIVHTSKFSDTAADNTTWVIGTSTARTATGTPFFSITSPENRGVTVASPGIVPASSTAAVAGNQNAPTSTKVTLRPNDWLNVNVVSPSFAGSEVEGTCSFILQEF